MPGGIPLRTMYYGIGTTEGKPTMDDIETYPYLLARHANLGGSNPEDDAAIIIGNSIGQPDSDVPMRNDGSIIQEKPIDVMKKIKMPGPDNYAHQYGLME